MTNNWLDIIKEKFYFQEKKVPEQIWLNVQKIYRRKNKGEDFSYLFFI
jgi:hypothetical protein